MAEDQSDVEHVAQQPLGQRRHAIADAGAVQDHQVDVAIRGHVAPPVAGVGDQRDLRPEPIGTVLVQIGQRRLGKIDERPRRADRSWPHRVRRPSSPRYGAARNSACPWASRSLAASTFGRSEDMGRG